MSDRSLKTKIEEWLEKQGYPLEMRVASIFGRHGFRVIQSDYYTDPRTNAQREIDIYAAMQRSFRTTFIRLAVFAECKSSTSKPWIVFVSSETTLADRARVVQRSSTILGHEWLQSIASRKDVCNLSIFQLPTKPGYGVTAAFSDGTDVPYAALVGAATAADAEAQSYDKGSQRLFFSVHFPIVITEAPLFTCELDPNNNTPILREVDHAVLAWRNPVYRLPHCITHIVQAKAADAFAEKVSSDFQFLLENTESELEAIAKIPSFSRLMAAELQTKKRKGKNAKR